MMHGNMNIKIWLYLFLVYLSMLSIAQTVYFSFGLVAGLSPGWPVLDPMPVLRDLFPPPWHWDRISPEYFAFSPLSLSHQCFVPVYSSFPTLNDARSWQHLSVAQLKITQLWVTKWLMHEEVGILQKEILLDILWIVTSFLGVFHTRLPESK